jgi:hypothetical protein
MDDTMQLLYEAPTEYDSTSLKRLVDELLENSESRTVVLEHLVPLLNNQGIAGKSLDPAKILDSVRHVHITDQGAGFEPTSVAILVSLVPFVKALTPLLEPFAKNAAEAAKIISLDLWRLIKMELLARQQIRLREKNPAQGRHER